MIMLKGCEKNKISISKLENECGLGNATIKGWKNSSPTVETIKKVADYFNVTVDELIAEKGENEEIFELDNKLFQKAFCKNMKSIGFRVY